MAVPISQVLPQAIDEPSQWEALRQGVQFLVDSGPLTTLWFALWVWIGAVASHLFAFQSEFQGARGSLAELFPNRSAVFHAWANLWICTVFGTILGTALVSPSSVQDAVFTGLVWPVLVRGALAIKEGAPGKDTGGKASNMSIAEGGPTSSSRGGVLQVEVRRIDRRSGIDRRSRTTDSTVIVSPEGESHP
jgi:hypothetical protein